MIDEIKKIREARHAADESLFAQQNRMRAKEYQLARARRLGKAGAEQVAGIEREIAALKEVVDSGPIQPAVPERPSCRGSSANSSCLNHRSSWRLNWTTAFRACCFRCAWKRGS